MYARLLLPHSLVDVCCACIDVCCVAQGVDNVYTQHTPLLTATLTDLSTDKLDVGSYPFMAASQVSV